MTATSARRALRALDDRIKRASKKVLAEIADAVYSGRPKSTYAVAYLDALSAVQTLMDGGEPRDSKGYWR